MPLEKSHRDYFESLCRRSNAAVGRHDLQQALELCEEALEWADHYGGLTDRDFAYCRKCAVLLHMGRGDSIVRELQKILMRSSDAPTRHVAAHNISCYYAQTENTSKSFFYARLALELAEKTGCAFQLACSYNRLGNLLILDSKFGEALQQYESALRYLDEEQECERLSLTANIGYCLLASGQHDEGFEHLFTARRGYIRFRMGSSSALARLRLSFCFGYLEIRRHYRAKLHGLAGLEIAEACGDQELIKKALYLLGEVEKQAGDEFAAYSRYFRLQEDYYPDNPYLPELLLNTETYQLVNLWA